MTAVPDTARRKPRQERTPFGALAAVAERVVERSETLSWPSPKYQGDPVAFARDILGIELWAAQIEIIEAIRDHRNVTVRSGHKCGKSTALAVAALWFYCSFQGARVVMTAVKATQIDEVIWREVRRLHREAKYPIGGELHTIARSGLRDRRDDRQIWGITARDGEGLAGISGANVLVLADEASGIHDRFFEVLGSSLAGSGGVVRKCYISNPTRTTGEFWRSHNTNAAAFKTIHVSSEDTPNARGEKPIPGLAGAEWIAEKKLEYGEESATYNVRVRGNFSAGLEGKIISTELIELGQSGWHLVPETGQLQLGIDPAGEAEATPGRATYSNDETAIAVRRGNKILTVLAWRGISEEAIVEHALALLRKYRLDREATPRIAVDAGGGIGTRVHAKLRAARDLGDDFDLIEVRSDRKAWGSPDYDLVRDALWGTMRTWMNGGGAIPTDAKLAADLNAPSFTEDKAKRLVATDKKTLRKELGRSTDRGDAACLSVWGFAGVVSAADAQQDRAVAEAREEVHAPEDRGEEIDPYAAADFWSRRS